MAACSRHGCVLTPWPLCIEYATPTYDRFPRERLPARVPRCPARAQVWHEDGTRIGDEEWEEHLSAHLANGASPDPTFGPQRSNTSQRT